MKSPPGKCRALSLSCHLASYVGGVTLGSFAVDLAIGYGAFKVAGLIIPESSFVTQLRTSRPTSLSQDALSFEFSSGRFGQPSITRSADSILRSLPEGKPASNQGINSVESQFSHFAEVARVALSTENTTAPGRIGDLRSQLNVIDTEPF